MKSNYRPGSMGAADEKSTRMWLIVASIVVGIIISLFLIHFNVHGSFGYFHAYFVRAASLSKVIGLLAAAGWYWFLWKKSGDIITGAGDKGSIAAVLIVGVALIICLLAGFNFSLMGIE